MAMESERKLTGLPTGRIGWRKRLCWHGGVGLAAAGLWLAAGCSQPVPLESWEEFPEEPYRRGEVIGYAPSGLPVYGVDDDGQPVFQPVAEPEDPEY